MPAFAVRLARLGGWLLLALAAVVALAVLFLGLITLTDGAGSGLAAFVPTLAVGVAVALRRSRRRTRAARLLPFLPVLAAAALTASVCVPASPTARQYPPDLPFVTTEY
ncbi:hypothetical protein [Kitasatospora sp. NPDC058478]|uniref:hypothetical protein n=1 Tax=unclassified Kitasatospora TaxID=2633591 RepID=UPI0036513BB0